MTAVLRFAASIGILLAFIILGLVLTRDAHSQDAWVFCPPPIEGRVGDVRLEASGTSFGIGDELLLTCVNSDGEEEVVGEALVIRYVPEPRGMLPVGLVALVLLGRRRR